MLAEFSSYDTDLNAQHLSLPEDGTPGLLSPHARFWSPVPAAADPDARDAGERRPPLVYEPVTTVDGKLLDVVAWDPSEPHVWWLQSGYGAWTVLGSCELLRVQWTHLPMTLVSAPAGWRHLRTSPQQRCSVCILDWDVIDTVETFGPVWGTIICASAALAHKLRARNLACGGRPLLLTVDLDLA